MGSRRQSLAGRVAAHERWARTPDRAAATEPARRGFMARFEHEVDPEGSMGPDVRAKLARSAMRAYMSRLAMKRRRGAA